jgi:ribosomal protein S18 acetylase RimI-like enzyme
MSDTSHLKKMPPQPTVELVMEELEPHDINDLCDATDAAIEGGGGFGWIELPSREILERYWNGVVTIPSRILFVARLDGVICGTCQLVKPPANNEAQAHAITLTTNFVAPWARGHGLAKMLVTGAEQTAKQEGFAVINRDVRETHDDAIQLYKNMGYEKFGAHPYSVRLPARGSDEAKTITSLYFYKLIDEGAFD